MRLITRVLLPAVALTLPFGNVGCSKKVEENKIDIVRPLNETEIKLRTLIRKEREALKESEHLFVRGLYDWASIDTVITLSNLGVGIAQSKESEKIKEGEKLILAASKLSELSSDFSEGLILVIGFGIRLGTKPSDEQVKSFTRLIDEIDTVTNLLQPYMQFPANDIAEKFCKNFDSEDKKIVVNQFQRYKKNLKKLTSMKIRLINDIKKFNEDVKTTIEPVYTPPWGLSIERLKGLKSF